MTSTSPGAVGTTSDSSIRRGPDDPQVVPEGIGLARRVVSSTDQCEMAYTRLLIHRLDHATGRCAACGQIAPCPAASEAALSLVRLGGQEPSPPVLAGVAPVSVTAPAPHLTSGTSTPVWPG
jgi:hypothetical protein